MHHKTKTSFLNQHNLQTPQFLNPYPPQFFHPYTTYKPHNSSIRTTRKSLNSSTYIPRTKSVSCIHIKSVPVHTKPVSLASKIIGPVPVLTTLQSRVLRRYLRIVAAVMAPLNSLVISLCSSTDVVSSSSSRHQSMNAPICAVILDGCPLRQLCSRLRFSCHRKIQQQTVSLMVCSPSSCILRTIEEIFSHGCHKATNLSLA